jgi:hypothetical protein
MSAITLSDEDRNLKAELEAKHGVVCHRIAYGNIVVWLRDPTQDDVALYMLEKLDDRTKGTAFLDLARRCCVLPEAGLNDALKKKAGALIPIARAFLLASLVDVPDSDVVVTSVVHEAQECHRVELAGIAAIFREPSIADINLYMSEQVTPSTMGTALIDLARRCCVDPKPKADGTGGLLAAVAKRPGAILEIANGFAKAAGIGGEAALGK